MDDVVGWRVVADVDHADAELVADRLFARGALGIEEQGAPDGRVRLLAGMPDEASARAVAAELGEATVEPVRDDGWSDAWRGWARPVRVGAVVVQPPWISPLPPRDGDVVVEIDPGRAFGSGAHETTQLALGALLDLQPGADTYLLDVGCGSGVLGVAAARLTGARVTAVDVDPEAIVATESNAARNCVAHLVDVSMTPIGEVDGAFDVVVANILAGTLREIAPDVARVVRPHGHVVLSGLLAEQRRGVDAAYVAVGFTAVGVRSEGDWCAVTYVRSAPR
jgi:ribosomal protein L11 methyltransferase